MLLPPGGMELQEAIFDVFLSRAQELLRAISAGRRTQIDASLRALLEAIESYFYR